MNPENLKLLYFSPTATTKVILEQIARGIGRDVSTTIDITKAGTREKPAPGFMDDLVLIGAPVYAGRLQEDAARYLKTITASGCLAVLVVLYGNREFEDALLELKDITSGCGFFPVAGAAFIGEHSFTSDEFPIAVNRPDKADLESAYGFGKQVADLIGRIEKPADLKPVDVPGNFPYKGGVSFGSFSFIDVTKECDGCDICVDACPKDAIDQADDYATVDELCIYCCACIKACPQKARVMKEGQIKDKAKWLSENCATRKEPRIFMAEKAAPR